MSVFLKIFLLVTLIAGVLLGADFLARGEIASFFEAPFYSGLGFFMLALVVLLAILLVLNLFQRRWDRFFRAIYFVWAVYFGFATIMFFGFALLYVLNLFFELPRFALEVIYPASAAGLTILGIWEGRQIVVKKIKIPTAGISRDLKIAHLSDLHLGPLSGREYLADVVMRTNALEPDLVVLTGDLFDVASGASIEILQPLQNLTAPIYFVFGNHDIRLKDASFLKIFETTPLRILRDEHVHFSDELEIVGLDGSTFNCAASLEYLANLLPKNRFRLLLTHAPIVFRKACAAGIDLQLAGHLHAGQIFPFNLIVKIFYFPFSSGLYEKNGTNVHISPGTGTWGPPIRLGSRNEITLIRLSAGE